MCDHMKRALGMLSDRGGHILCPPYVKGVGKSERPRRDIKVGPRKKKLAVLLYKNYGRPEK